LRAALWPEPRWESGRERIRELELRAQLLSTAARLGHSLIDLYLLTIRRTNSLEPGALDAEGAEGEGQDRRRIEEYLDVLEVQRTSALAERRWAAFDELHETAQNYDLILDVNAPDARGTPLSETKKYFGSLLRQQQPTGGMYGQVNKTLVQQFRMPGYPFVLVTTELLQEGEDLHPFCSSVHHYGIAWTPSAMEQRIGRIDRVRSQTDRRLCGAAKAPEGEHLLQVFYPHLEDTVEVLQVRRVLNRMNTFLRLMHDGLFVPRGDQRTVNVREELAAVAQPCDTIPERLHSAFPVPAWALRGPRRSLAADEATCAAIRDRFEGLPRHEYGLTISWEPSARNGILLGTARLSSGRIQPFALLLRSFGDQPLIRCISPVGRVGPETKVDEVEASARSRRVKVGAVISEVAHQYDLTAEGEVVLGAHQYDSSRVGVLLRRILDQSDVLEQTHLPLLDQPLVAFEADLSKEGQPRGD